MKQNSQLSLDLNANIAENDRAFINFEDAKKKYLQSQDAILIAEMFKATNNLRQDYLIKKA